MYGTQAQRLNNMRATLFENDVKMYGTQAKTYYLASTYMFENDVKMYGTQAYAALIHDCLSLRMM